MPLHVIRYDDAGAARWGLLLDGGVALLSIDAATTAELLAAGPSALRAATLRERHPLDALRLLSPVTAPCRIVCQGANYRGHMIDAGLDPDAKDYNMFFTKSDASLAPPVGELRAPAHVKLLDYELELGLVIGTALDRSVTLDADGLARHVAALVMVNDVTARDVQLPQLQWFKGKSYRGFCPTGPVLCVLEPGDHALIDALDLTLTVNGEVRQQDSTANLVFKPAETLSELSTCCDLSPGDLLLTGTPAGCGLKAPSALLQKIAGLLPEKMKWRAFVRTQSRRRQYLRSGDVMRSTIASADGRIDLGAQALTVR
jgi:2-keto-4-pentenoate hydratase/2-oxohepta-3-ene-1,7-dioic acid hydratase in catechol pathway